MLRRRFFPCLFRHTIDGRLCQAKPTTNESILLLTFHTHHTPPSTFRHSSPPEHFKLSGAGYLT